jgi:transposase
MNTFVACQEGGYPCHSNLHPFHHFPKKRPEWLASCFLVGMRSCNCVTRWVQSTPMRRLLICFPPTASPARAPWRLALVTVFQFMEHLTDRQAADAVRSRLDWKYALSLDLTDPGFDHTVLSEFRSRLVADNAEQRLLDLFLERCREGGWRQRSGAGNAPTRPMSWPRSVRSTEYSASLRRWSMCGMCSPRSPPSMGVHPRASRVGRALWGAART